MSIDCQRSEAILPGWKVSVLRKIFAVCSLGRVVLAITVFVQEDYLHLVKVLTTHVCKSLKLKSGVSARWSVGEGSRGVVRELVQRVMSQCTVYSAHLQLGLSES